MYRETSEETLFIKLLIQEYLNTMPFYKDGHVGLPSFPATNSEWGDDITGEGW